MALAAARQRRSPVRVELPDLIALRPVGEALKLPGSRVRVQSAGGHLSTFKGRGVEYDESRPYQAGDDLRTFDWRVTARTGKPHTKVYRDERNRPVLVWLDLGRSMHFATRGAFKSVVAAEIAAIIAWAAVANGDRLGGLVFSGDLHRELRPRLGRRAALALLSAAADPAFHDDAAADAATTTHTATRATTHTANHRATHPATHTAGNTAGQALDRLTRVVRPGSLVFLLSDFQNLGADAERQLWQLRSHADLVLVHVCDPLEGELPPPGRYRIQQGLRTLAIDTAPRAARELYRRRSEAHRERLRAVARPSGMHLIECATTDAPASVLAAQFMRR